MEIVMQPGLTADAADLDYGSIGALISALYARKISASELLAHTIARIEALDGQINAVIVRDFDRARDAARAADAALARGERQPLLGIPVTLKEPFNVAGLPTTWGFPQFRDFQPPEDALVVSRLKAAGAIIIGKTNIPIGLRDFQSYNEIYGTTNNPWDLGRSPGGSQADRERRWPQASVRSRSARISAARSGCRRISAACSDTSQASAWSRCADTVCRRQRPFPVRAIWLS
jgi:amidase